MSGIRYAKDKNAETTEKKRATRAATNPEEISKQMALGKATVEKIEAIEDDDVRVEAVGNLTKIRMSAMLVICRNTVRV